MYCLIVSRFSGVGEQGNLGESVGGSVRFGQLQGISSGPTTPVFVHFGSEAPAKKFGEPVAFAGGGD